MDSVTAIDRNSTVAVVGVGTMGQGIAQVALLAGHRVVLHDAVPGRAQVAADGVAGRLDRLVAKGRIGASDHKEALARLVPAQSSADLACDAVGRQVASASDIDTAMRLGVSYPLGPLEWCELVSAGYVRDLLDALHRDSPTGRYAPCRELRRRADAAEGVISS